MGDFGCTTGFKDSDSYQGLATAPHLLQERVEGRAI